MAAAFANHSLSSRPPTLTKRPQREVSCPAAHPSRVPGNVQGVRSRKQRSPQQQVVVHFQQSRTLPFQRAPRPQWTRQVISQQQQQQHKLSEWSHRFQRQVRALPQGKTALINLLQAVEALLAKAEHCGSHSAVMKAYLCLGLVDITSQAWQERAAQLEDAQDKMPAEQYKQQHLEAELALSGCRFMRIEAAQQLAKQLHILLDNEGYCPSLNLASLPAPHALGLRIPQLLREGLGLDLQNPVLRSMDAASTASMQHLSWDEYSALSADQSMCGEWQFCYWVGDATWVPAPFGKFSTHELYSVLSRDVMLASLPNGIWGRALVAAAQEQAGLQVATSTQQEATHAAQQQLSTAAAAAAAASSMPEAVRALINESTAGASSSRFASRVREFSNVVAAVRSTLAGRPVPSTQGASVQSN